MSNHGESPRLIAEHPNMLGGASDAARADLMATACFFAILSVRARVVATERGAT